MCICGCSTWGSNFSRNQMNWDSCSSSGIASPLSIRHNCKQSRRPSTSSTATFKTSSNNCASWSTSNRTKHCSTSRWSNHCKTNSLRATLSWHKHWHEWSKQSLSIVLDKGAIQLKVVSRCSSSKRKACSSGMLQSRKWSRHACKLQQAWKTFYSAVCQSARSTRSRLRISTE
jgi:hypothetical protein